MGLIMDDEVTQRMIDTPEHQPDEPAKYKAMYNGALERIRQLEAQCATLAAQVDRMGPVIEAAQARVESLRQIHSDGWTQDEDVLVRDVTTYEHEMAHLACAQRP